MEDITENANLNQVMEKAKRVIEPHQIALMKNMIEFDHWCQFDKVLTLNHQHKKRMHHTHLDFSNGFRSSSRYSGQ